MDVSNYCKNVATAEATVDLITAGADAVKVEFGSWFYLYNKNSCWS